MLCWESSNFQTGLLCEAGSNIFIRAISLCERTKRGRQTEVGLKLFHRVLYLLCNYRCCMLLNKQLVFHTILFHSHKLWSPETFFDGLFLCLGLDCTQASFLVKTRSLYYLDDSSIFRRFYFIMSYSLSSSILLSLLYWAATLC
jgi:hypothetical protein